MEEVKKEVEDQPKKESIKEKEDRELMDLMEKTCPHCGMNVDIPKFEVTEEDKDLWLRYIMSRGKQPFTKSFSIYGGRITATFRTRTVTEEKDIDIGLAELITTVSEIASMNKMRVETLKLQMVYSLESLIYTGDESLEDNASAYGTRYPEEEIQKGWASDKSLCAEKCDEILGSIPHHVLTLLVDKLVDFNTICSALTVQGLSENF